ncbi:MAG: TVP38/TMEM64 family protein [Clostridia bacterium]|jgi:uncharacterized membrane protein YdjX (TVP38/TMEM64 family)|nr:TVP38/TMEM64 family protein [Clostridia bacterium]
MKKVILIGILLIIGYILFFTNTSESIKSFFDYSEAGREQMEYYLNNEYIKFVLIFIIAYIISISLSLPVGAVLSTFAGFAFGKLYGMVYVIIGATIGASLSFVIVRYLIGSDLQLKYKDKLDKFNKEIEENGKYYLYTIRFLPFLPFYLVNIFVALTKVKYKDFALSTAIGIIPGSFAYVYLGESIYKLSTSSDKIDPSIFIALILLGAVSLAPVIYKKIGVK